MTFEDIQEIIAKDEHRCLELKKTTGELQDGMHSACAFLNTDGGWLIFGVAPTSLKILGQQVTDSTQREIAQALAYGGGESISPVKDELRSPQLRFGRFPAHAERHRAGFSAAHSSAPEILRNGGLFKG